MISQLIIAKLILYFYLSLSDSFIATLIIFTIIINLIISHKHATKSVRIDQFDSSLILILCNINFFTYYIVENLAIPKNSIDPYSNLG